MPVHTPLQVATNRYWLVVVSFLLGLLQNGKKGTYRPGAEYKTGVTIDDKNKDEDDKEESISTMDKVKETETTHTAVAVAEATMPVPVVAQATNPETGIPIQFEDLQWKRSNDPKILDATRITVSLKDQGPTFLLESVLSYEESGIRQLSYPERLYLIMLWMRWFEFLV